MYTHGDQYVHLWTGLGSYKQDCDSNDKTTDKYHHNLRFQADLDYCAPFTEVEYRAEVVDYPECEGRECRDDYVSVSGVGRTEEDADGEVVSHRRFIGDFTLVEGDIEHHGCR
jgi:hypothetical protein